MNSQPRLATFVRILFALLVIAIAFTLLFKARSKPALAKTQTVPPTKRLFENRVPEHLPIKVKIKREKEELYRDLNNENWARYLEIEVKNTGEKPIYFLCFGLDVPDAKIQTSYQSFAIVYGRVGLSRWEERPTPEDVPIKPGETIVLKIEGNQLRGWDQARDSGLVPKQIRGARLVFQDLSFGDGTGFDGGMGAPWPRPQKDKRSAYLSRRGSYDQRSEPVALRDIQAGSENVDEQSDAGMFQTCTE